MHLHYLYSLVYVIVFAGDIAENGVEGQTQLGATLTGRRKRPPEDDGFEEALDILEQDDLATHSEFYITG